VPQILVLPHTVPTLYFPQLPQLAVGAVHRMGSFRYFPQLPQLAVGAVHRMGSFRVEMVAQVEAVIQQAHSAQKAQGLLGREEMAQMEVRRPMAAVEEEPKEIMLVDQTVPTAWIPI
jgi:hypothetical protein